MVAAFCRVRWVLALLVPAVIACGQSPAPTADGDVEHGRTAVVTFVDCVVYAGATHFYFRQADGGELRLVESNDEGAARIANADILLDPHPVEGPPGPNPALVGRAVMLHYDEQNQVTGLSLVFE